MKPILEVSHVNTKYHKSKHFSFQKGKTQEVLKDISFTMKKGEILGVVGESGCGKTTLAKAILGMIAQIDGDIMHHTKNPQMIFQDPYRSLNPAKTVGWILQEPLRNKGGYKASQRTEKAIEMLYKIGLDERYMKHYPKQLSGGQRQRVCIGAALMLEPKLVIADEPVSALDVTIQKRIIDLLLQLQKEMGLSILFISHDLSVVYQICNEVMIMKQGSIIEKGSVEKVYFSPEQQYTKELLQAAGILKY